MTEAQIDELLNDLTLAAAETIREVAGIRVDLDDMYKINDFFTAFLADKGIA